MIRLPMVAALLLYLATLLGLGQPGFDERVGAKIWVGRYQEIEEYLKTAECVSMLETFGRNGEASCGLRPGGPVARIAWRPVPPGVYRGFRESYKAEIAAYGIDKLLKMDMVPPSVERRLDGKIGAAQLWVENVVDLKANASPDESIRTRWQNQLARMTMFDDLIGNRDRNVGNTLRDDSWNLILLDHSRALTASTDLPRKLTRIDGAFWDKIENLTRPQLDAALSAWLSKNEIQSILDRREKMRAEIKSLPR
jgi:hypothetical protein